MFNVTELTISTLCTRKTYRQADGKISAPQRPKVPDDVRREIKSLYKKNTREFDIRALGKLFGFDSSTILRIVREDMVLTDEKLKRERGLAVRGITSTAGAGKPAPWLNGR